MTTGAWEALENFRWEAFHWRKTTSLPVKLGLSLLGAAVIGLAAQIKIPLPWTPVPITGQTFAVLLMGVLLGAGGGFLSTALYLLLGGLGVPWFAGASGGVGALAGPTAGYLAGFILAACFTGYMYDRYAWARSLPGLLLVMLAADLILIHGTGLIWLSQVTGVRAFKELLMLGSLPFISGDLAKIAALAMLVRAIAPRRDF